MSEALLAYLADGLVGGTALAVIATLLCAIPAVRARASLVFALWAVVIARFVVPGLIPIELPLSIAPAGGGIDVGFVAPAWVSESPAGPTTPGWQLWLAGLWLAGAASIGAVSALGWWRLRRRIAALPDAPAPVQARAASIARALGVSRSIAVKTDASRGPYAAGLVSPVVVLPDFVGRGQQAPTKSDNNESLDGDELDDVLAHEIAHHRRLDPLAALVARIAQIAFFFWPVVWLACRRLDAARERATDRLAVERCGRDRRRYARTLVRVTLRARTASALAMAGDGSQLRARIDELLAGASTGVGRLGALAIAALVGLGLPAATAVTAAPDPGPIECTITPGLGARILASHPDADRDGDGVLSRDEICEHQRRMQRRLVDAAVRADVIASESVPMSRATVSALADVTALDIEMADAGGAVCTEVETANRCVEEMVLIDVSAD